MTMRCTFKSFNKVRLCPADLTHLVDVCSRSIAGDNPWDMTQENTTLAQVQPLYMACETVSPYKPVTGVNTGDKITHIYYARYADVSVQIDVKEHVLKVDGVVYRIDSVEDLNNFKETLAFYCFIRGTGLEANA
jgi:hypothetical protein